MSNIVGQIEVTFLGDITQDMVDDILVAAFEGGINYWCRRIEVVDGDYHGGKYASDVISRGGAIHFSTFEEEEELHGEVMVLNLKKFIDGFKQYCERVGKDPERVYDNHDAGVADLIVQYALFGKVIYG
jgi:hypothetical protein